MTASACSSCKPGEPPPDAETDASRDGSVDGTLDVGVVDACVITNATTLDAGSPFIGDWRLLNGAPCNCQVMIDHTPDKDISAFTWVSCASNKPGCTRLAIDWTNDPGWQIDFPDHPASVVNGSEVLTYVRRFPNGLAAPRVLITVTGDLGGHAQFAHGTFWGTSASCLGQQTMGDGGTVFAFVANDLTQILGYGPNGNLDSTTVSRHSQTDLGMLSGPMGGTTQRLVANDDTLFLNTSAPFSITLYNPLSNKITLVNDTNGRIQAENPAPTEAGAVALDATLTRGLYFIAMDGTFARVYVPPAGSATFDVASDESQGSAFVWLQGQLSGLDYTNMAVWMEPYTTTLAGSQAKRITGIDTTYNYGGGMAVNAGMALLLTSATTAELVRLSDGWAWSIDAEPGDHWAKPVWVNANEVWLAVASAQTTLEDGLVKFQLSSLGAPTIPPK